MTDEGGEGALALSELEGAILSEIYHRGRQTAFKVRRSFADSPSLEWRGSAGAIYGAIAKLERAGLISAEAMADRRAGRLLSVTAEGERAMLLWASDPARACSVGIDPFRMRAGIWAGMQDGGQASTLAPIRQALVHNIEYLESFSRRDDAIERHSVELALTLQRARLDWLDRMVETGKMKIAAS
jgi:DNA-binding PadR family transcriptional regulator